MKNEIAYIKREIAKNNIVLSKAEQITNEIKDNAKYHLNDDDFVLM